MSVNVVSRHLGYVVKNAVDVSLEQEELPSFYWLPKPHKTPYDTRFRTASNKGVFTHCTKIRTAFELA